MPRLPQQVRAFTAKARDDFSGPLNPQQTAATLCLRRAENTLLEEMPDPSHVLWDPKADMNDGSFAFRAHLEAALLEHFQHGDILGQDLCDQFA